MPNAADWTACVGAGCGAGAGLAGRKARCVTGSARGLRLRRRDPDPALPFEGDLEFLTDFLGGPFRRTLDRFRARLSFQLRGASDDQADRASSGRQDRDGDEHARHFASTRLGLAHAQRPKAVASHLVALDHGPQFIGARAEAYEKALAGTALSDRDEIASDHEVAHARRGLAGRPHHRKSHGVNG